MIHYRPAFSSEMHKVHEKSAWVGLERIVPSILWRFQPGRKIALEFGVEYGFSCGIWAQLFDEVVGVDLFLGQEHRSACGPCFLHDTQQALSNYSHVKLVQGDCLSFMQQPENDRQYSLIHLDSVPHTVAAPWAVRHTHLVLCHDTENSQIRDIYQQLADDTGWKLYNYPGHHGLGILTDL